MLNANLFISDKIEERSVELGDGTSEVLYFKHLSNTIFERYAIWTASADEDVVAIASSRLIVLGLCNSDGTPALTLNEAERLKRPVMQRVMQALLEVNGYGKKPGNA